MKMFCGFMAAILSVIFFPVGVVIAGIKLGIEAGIIWTDEAMENIEKWHKKRKESVK